MSGYRGRFAPSPTGLVHLGTARTALVAWLRARSLGGALVMRMEDIDTPRVRPGMADAILEDLRFLGLDWDEGPDVGGPHAPYTQSDRTGLYRDALAKLEAAGVIYRCSCTRRELSESASAPHGEEPVYPGTCRHGPTHPERPTSWRFRLDRGEPFDDALMGRREDGTRSGDFVLKRSDGLFAYQLAVVVDDLEMQITEVVRGADLLSSTPRQIALARALGGAPPSYFHVPLVLVPFARSSLGLVPEGAPARAKDLVSTFDPRRLPTSAAAIALG